MTSVVRRVLNTAFPETAHDRGRYPGRGFAEKFRSHPGAPRTFPPRLEAQLPAAGVAGHAAWLALKMTGILGVIGRTARRRHQIASCRTYQQRLEKHGDPTPRVLKGPRSAESEIVTGGCSF